MGLCKMVGELLLGRSQVSGDVGLEDSIRNFKVIFEVSQGGSAEVYQPLSAVLGTVLKKVTPVPSLGKKAKGKSIELKQPQSHSDSVGLVDPVPLIASLHRDIGKLGKNHSPLVVASSLEQLKLYMIGVVPVV